MKRCESYFCIGVATILAVMLMGCRSSEQAPYSLCYTVSVDTVARYLNVRLAY